MRVMKSTVVLLGSLAALLAPAAAKADVLMTYYDNGLTVEPIDLLTGTFNLQYERAFSPSWSAYLGLNYLYVSGADQPNSGTQLALGPEIGLRLYLIGRAPAGLWIGPDLSTAWVRDVSYGQEFDSLGYSVGGMVGVNLVLGHFTGSLGFGGNFYDYSHYDGATRVGFYGLEMRERLAVGVVF
jgi:hypothetical protein